MPTAFHLNTVNNLHQRWKEFMPVFCGPATENLVAYVGWFAAQEEGHLTAFRATIA